MLPLAGTAWRRIAYQTLTASEIPKAKEMYSSLAISTTPPRAEGDVLTAWVAPSANLSRSALNRAWQSIPSEEGRNSHQKEEKGSDELAGGGGNVSFDRGWETLTKRLRDQSLSIRVGARPGSPLPRTRRHCGSLAWKRYELNWILVAQMRRPG